MNVRDFFTEMLVTVVSGWVYEEKLEERVFRGLIDRANNGGSYITFLFNERFINNKKLEGVIFDGEAMAVSGPQLSIFEVSDCVRDGDIFRFKHERFGDITVSPAVPMKEIVIAPRDFFLQMKKSGVEGYLYSKSDEGGGLSGSVTSMDYNLTYVLFMLKNRVIKMKDCGERKLSDTTDMPTPRMSFTEITDCKRDGDKFTFTHARFGTFTVSPV